MWLEAWYQARTCNEALVGHDAEEIDGVLVVEGIHLAAVGTGEVEPTALADIYFVAQPKMLFQLIAIGASVRTIDYVNLEHGESRASMFLGRGAFLSPSRNLGIGQGWISCLRKALTTAWTLLAASSFCLALR